MNLPPLGVLSAAVIGVSLLALVRPSMPPWIVTGAANAWLVWLLVA